MNYMVRTLRFWGAFSYIGEDFMGIGKVAGDTALELIKNENVQNKAVGMMGMLFPYAGLTKKAVDMYIDEIEKSDMSPEAKVFSVVNARKTIKKIRNQKSIADIAMNNAKEGTDFSDKSGVSEEWLERFMDSAGFVSAEDIQIIWGKILANEFENPGTTPPNMIRILSEITPNLAMAFKKICSMKIWICPLSEQEEIVGAFQKVFVPYKKNEEQLREMGISFNVLNELETLGVIKLETIGGYITQGIENKKVLICVGDKLDVICEHNNDNIPIGNVLLTSVGEALQTITDSEEIPQYYEMIKKYLLDQNVKLSEKHNFVAKVEGEALSISKNSE